MQTTIEIPKIEDFEKVNVLAKQVHELHVNWRPDLFLSVDEVISKENFEKMIQAKEIFVAKKQDEIVGYITINIKEKNNPSMRYRKQLQIEAICVDEKTRGKGIGTQLLKYVKQYGKENDCTDIYLTVNEENASAIKMYEEFGFKVKSIFNENIKRELVRMKYFKKLIGERIYLSPMSIEDAEKYVEWLSDFKVTDGLGRSSNLMKIEDEKTWIMN